MEVNYGTIKNIMEVIKANKNKNIHAVLPGVTILGDHMSSLSWLLENQEVILRGNGRSTRVKNILTHAGRCKGERIWLAEEEIFLPVRRYFFLEARFSWRASCRRV